MRRVLALALVAMWLIPGVALAADTVAVGDLLADSADYDASVVGEIMVRGELVGDFQRRSDVVWVQLNDDPYVDAPLLDGGVGSGANMGIGVRIPVAMFDRLGVSTPGGYRVRGPVVRVVGEWRHHDEGRGGESYLDATSVEVLEVERRLDEEPRLGVLLFGAVLLVVSGAVAVRRRRS